MRIDASAHDLVDREGLIDAALSAHVALLTSERPREARYAERLARLRDLLAARVEAALSPGAHRRSSEYLAKTPSPNDRAFASLDPLLSSSGGKGALTDPPGSCLYHG